MSLAPFVRTGDGVHPTLDYAALSAHYGDRRRSPWCITSPVDLLGWQEGREEFGITEFPRVETDLFVWGAGEPPDARLTRVGGVPFLPRRAAWPRIRGTDATFFCQFDFRDSRDLVGDLPGDLLLVFVEDVEETPLMGDRAGMHFEWVSADERDVVSADDMPRGVRWPFVKTWGVRHRSYDAPAAFERISAMSDRELDKLHEDAFELPVHWATKIGGMPYQSQERGAQVPDGFLCQLVSIQAAADTEWPWCDVREPLSSYGDDSVHADHNDLMIGDMGELSCYLRPDGTVEVEAACG